ncbi:MAG: gliding motility-associated protein GldM [Cyclobacteriaceae bacterium]|jgi:gliding motility-associated protein GldM
MSGGKETGRQKMIGMMYLVLTALLALNVSSTVIDKFVFLNDSLVRANKETEERNAAILNNIVKTVDDSGNRADDLKVVEAAQNLRSETSRVLEEMLKIKLEMVEISGGYNEGFSAKYPGDGKNLVGKTDYDKVGHHMMPVDEGGGGQGEILKELLNGFTDKVKLKLASMGADESVTHQIKKIALDADEDEVYREDTNQKGKVFADLAFSSAPTPAALATMSEFESRVLGYETRGLDFFASKVGAGDLKFDVIVPMVKPESKYVAAGARYSAKMFIAASSSGVTPTMTYNDKPITVDASGQGSVEFLASASNYDNEGLSRQTYKADITVNTGTGDTTFSTEIEYYVVKPVISIQSQSVNALYLNCGNKLDVQVPALGTTYNPSFSATNGSAIKGSEKGQVTIVPNSQKEVTLSVSSGGNLVGTRSFGVRKIPQPALKAFTAQGEVNMKSGISAKSPRLQLQVIPDESFMQFLPDDAKFRVAQAEVTLVSGGIGRVTLPVGEQINLASIAAQARKGDQLVIEIKRVQRQNFKGDVEDFPISQRFINIPLN